MKCNILLLILVLQCFTLSCSRSEEQFDSLPLDDKFLVSMPEPASSINEVELTEPQKNLVSAHNRMGFNLLEASYKDKGCVISPLSIYLALAMVLNSADGKTADQITNVLGGSITEINTLSSALLSQLPAVDLKTKAHICNAVIVNDSFKLKDSYKEVIESVYYAPVEKLPFDNTDFVLKTVNGWCDRATEGMIPRILYNVDSQTMAYILSALFFKASWTEPIRHQQVFPFDGGQHLQYLCGSGKILYGSFDSFDAIAKDYGANGQYKFYLLLPKQNKCVKEVLSTLTSTDWCRIASGLTAKSLSFAFPKINIESHLSLKNQLEDLGVVDAFSSKADFSKMFENDWSFISDIIHKAVLEVDKNGSKGAAVTAIQMDGAPMLKENSFEFFANRPFVFVISESSSNTLLFSGVFDGKGGEEAMI